MALEIWQYAALAEHVYRRDSKDQGLVLDDIDRGLTGFQASGARATMLDANGITIGDSNPENIGFYINTANGFTASVVESGGEFIITFRGTDNSGAASILQQGIGILTGANSVTSGGRVVDGEVLEKMQLSKGESAE